MTTRVWLDLETRGRLDVTKVGVDRLCEDPALRLLSAHYALDAGPVRNWRGAFGGRIEALRTPDTLDPDPVHLLHAIEDGAEVWAHNVRFDRRVWNTCAPSLGWPLIRVEQTRDSASLCRLAHWPAALKDAAARAGGKKLANTTFRALWNAANPMTDAQLPLYEHMLTYGDRDVDEMRRVAAALPAPYPGFWGEWIASERVNDRGFAVDLDWCRIASAARERLTAEESARLSELTGGMVRTPKQTAAAMRWTELMLGMGDEFAVVKKRRIGGDRAGFRTEVRAGFDKNVRQKLREALLDDPEAGEVEARVLDVLDAIDAGSGAAVAKYDAALDRTSADGRLRGSYILRGASQTSRFSAGALQPHNLIRYHVGGGADGVHGERAFAQTIADYGRMLRSTVIAPDGRVVVWSDWSAIEARITPWLADADDCPAAIRATAQAVLGVFSRGEDIYLKAASDIYREPITKEQSEKRQVGKVSSLALGFGGSVGAFVAMARVYPDVKGQLATLDVPGIVASWREANPWALWLCKAVEGAAFRAVRRPGTPFQAGRLLMVAAPAALLMILPDGTWLSYPDPRIDMVDRFEKGEEAAQPTVTFRHPVFGRSTFSGPVCAENPTQAVAARLLIGAIREAQAAGLDVVMHTHDEIVIETEAGLEAVHGPTLAEIMLRAPAWAEGLPLAVEWEYGRHYHASEH